MEGELHGEQQCAPFFFLHISRKNSEKQPSHRGKFLTISENIYGFIV